MLFLWYNIFMRKFKHVYVEITKACNLKCKYCFADDMIQEESTCISIDDYRRVLEFIARTPKNHIGIIGGIEPTFIENCTLDMLEKNVRDLVQTMKGKRFVLANSDSCPPNVSYEKFLLVSDLIKKLS